jgi:hypothetical protein
VRPDHRSRSDTTDNLVPPPGTSRIASAEDADRAVDRGPQEIVGLGMLVLGRNDFVSRRNGSHEIAQMPSIGRLGRVAGSTPSDYVMHFFCIVVKGGAAACTVIGMQDGGTEAGAQHGGAGREANLIFVLPPNVYVGPPGRGTFCFQIFIQAPSLEIWRKTISGAEGGSGEEVGVACFGLPPWKKLSAA